jgi:hypothetical protein
MQLPAVDDLRHATSHDTTSGRLVSSGSTMKDRQ